MHWLISGDQTVIFKWIAFQLCHKWNSKFDKYRQKHMLLTSIWTSSTRAGKASILTPGFFTIIKPSFKCKNNINSKTNQVQDGIWTYEPPWSSRTLQPLSYWRLYGQQRWNVGETVSIRKPVRCNELNYHYFSSDSRVVFPPMCLLYMPGLEYIYVHSISLFLKRCLTEQFKPYVRICKTVYF